jgi:hypothetical protein
MKRPQFVHFMCVHTELYFSFKALVTLKENKTNPTRPIDGQIVELPLHSIIPIKSVRLLTAHTFTLKIVGLNTDRQEVFKKSFESDNFGSFSFKLPLTEITKEIDVLKVYETSFYPGLEINMGSFLPLKIAQNSKIIISDFDKTLVDTRYATAKEVYRSLTRPLSAFPTIPKSVEILKGYIDQGFHPFILSASPHFYEDAIRDWLYQNQIFTAGIFLKDYRHIFSFFEGELRPKDLKVQGLYKLNQLLNILLMTGIPEELVLMGDNFESDPLIYLLLTKIILDGENPRDIWQRIGRHESFLFNDTQDSKILNKLYQLKNNLNQSEQRPKISIYIRKKGKEVDIEKVSMDLEKFRPLLNLYDGNETRI